MLKSETAKLPGNPQLSINNCCKQSVCTIKRALPRVAMARMPTIEAEKLTPTQELRARASAENETCTPNHRCQCALEPKDYIMLAFVTTRKLPVNNRHQPPKHGTIGIPHSFPYSDRGARGRAVRRMIGFPRKNELTISFAGDAMGSATALTPTLN